MWYSQEEPSPSMNTMTFVFGQLLTLETFTAGQQSLWQQLQHQGQQRLQYHHRSSQPWKGFFMDNSILVIAFLIVSLIANFAMPTKTDDPSQ